MSQVTYGCVIKKEQRTIYEFSGDDIFFVKTYCLLDIKCVISKKSIDKGAFQSHTKKKIIFLETRESQLFIGWYFKAAKWLAHRFDHEWITHSFKNSSAEKYRMATSQLGRSIFNSFCSRKISTIIIENI